MGVLLKVKKARVTYQNARVCLTCVFLDLFITGAGHLNRSKRGVAAASCGPRRCPRPCLFNGEMKCVKGGKKKYFAKKNEKQNVIIVHG